MDAYGTTGDADKFVSLTQVDGGTIIFEGKNKRRIVGKGNIKLGNLMVEVIGLVKGLGHSPININHFVTKVTKIASKMVNVSGYVKTNPSHSQVRDMAIVICLTWVMTLLAT